MTLKDQLELNAIKKKYGPIVTMQDIVAKMAHVEADDWYRLGKILARLPFNDVYACVHHADYPAILERFIEIAGMPRLQAIAFLRIGIPVRGIVLPSYPRGILDVRVAFRGGVLSVNERPVPLPNLTLEELGRLRAYAALSEPNDRRAF